MSVKSRTSEQDILVPVGLDSTETDLVARFGSFFVTATAPFERPYWEVFDDIRQSLEQDSRVAWVRSAEELNESWCIPRQVFPSPAVGEGLAFQSDALHTLQFASSLLICVHVHSYVGDDETPTRYLISWDGFLAVVAWRVPKDRGVESPEGLVAREILGDALERINLQLYLQGCNPDCELKFAHTSIRFSPHSGETVGIDYADSDFLAEVEARCPDLTDEDLVDWLFTDLLLPIRSFAILKNLGRRILESELDARSSLGELMQINFRRARVSTIPWVGRARVQWSERGWLRSARLLIARIWLILSNIESLRREWSSKRFDFERASDARGLRRLFERDYADEVDRVDSLNVDLIRSAVQEAAERLDSRALLRVTAVAAIAGAMAGGAIGGLVSGGF